MSVPIALQTVQLAWSAVLGAALGMVYDLLRAMRRCLALPAAVADVVFTALVTLSLLLLSYCVGLGEFPLFMLLGLGCGAAFYFLVPSPFVLRGLCWFFKLFVHVLAAISGPFLFILKKSKKFSKKVFQSVKKWFRIKRNVIETAKRGPITHGGTTIAVETIPASGQTSDPGTGRIRRSYPAVAPPPASGRPGRDRAAVPAAGRGRTGRRRAGAGPGRR
jgi:hypothetical protein